jgi:glutamine amidotransferase
MCRFVGYLGLKPIPLSTLLIAPTNSLINQSRAALEDRSSVHGDGFGLGWYNHNIDQTPALFHSIQPAWNDLNLKYLAEKLESSCFLGHIRAATEGIVSEINCHPFSYGNRLFIHNGLVDQFTHIKQKLVSFLDASIYHNVCGQTDSEHIFALMNHFLLPIQGRVTLLDMAQAIKKTIAKLLEWQGGRNDKDMVILNCILTDGHSMLVCRYSNKPKQRVLTLYFSHEMQPVCGVGQAVVVSSERLSEASQKWQVVPNNYFLLIDHQLKHTLQPIEF